MSDQRPDNPFDAMRRVINHEANQDDDGGFFAKLGGIEPEHDDEPTAKGLFQHMDFARNSYTYDNVYSQKLCTEAPSLERINHYWKDRDPR